MYGNKNSNSGLKISTLSQVGAFLGSKYGWKSKNDNFPLIFAETVPFHIKLQYFKGEEYTGVKKKECVKIREKKKFKVDKKFRNEVKPGLF